MIRKVVFKHLLSYFVLIEGFDEEKPWKKKEKSCVFENMFPVVKTGAIVCNKKAAIFILSGLLF